MSISTHAELLTAVANWLHRADLTSIIPDFVTLAEARLNRRLRLRTQENTTTGTASSSVALPTGFVEVKSLRIVSGTSTWALAYKPPSMIGADTGTPGFYTIIGDNIVFDPSGSYTYSLSYWKKFDALSAGVNWLITNAPDVYLYATLLEAAPYIKNDARIPVWESRLETALADLIRADKHSRYGSTLAVGRA